MGDKKHNYPKLHNATWPGLVGKGGPDAEPIIEFETMLDMTASAKVDGQKFDGVDIFLSLPHTDIDSTDEQLKKLAHQVASRDLLIGSLVAPVWGPTGGGSAMGSVEERKAFLTQLRKSCEIANKLNELGIRKYGIVRIDSSCGPAEWSEDPLGNTKKIANTFREACNIAEGFGEKLAAEGEICWGGMHSWKYLQELLEEVDRPETLGIQADMAHTMLFTLGYNAPEHRLLPKGYDWADKEELYKALGKMTSVLRPWVKDFHVAQNDATVKGSGSHDKTGRHCLPNDPNGKMDVVRAAGLWLRDEKGEPTRNPHHINWDGCMFPNETMLEPQTWNNILATMIAVRDAHGWN